LLFVAACHHDGAQAAKPQGADTSAPVTAPAGAPHVNDASITCGDADHPRTVFETEIAFPSGCGPIPTEAGGNATSLEITVEGTPAKATFIEPVDLAATSVAFVSAGCAAAIRFASPAVGTLDLSFAATDEDGAKGTGHWKPAKGPECDVTVTAVINRHSGPE
jgi:hypothetical protein